MSATSIRTSGPAFARASSAIEGVVALYADIQTGCIGVAEDVVVPITTLQLIARPSTIDGVVTGPSVDRIFSFIAGCDRRPVPPEGVVAAASQNDIVGAPSVDPIVAVAPLNIVLAVLSQLCGLTIGSG